MRGGGGLFVMEILRLSSADISSTVALRLAIVAAGVSVTLLSLLFQAVRAVTWVLRSQTDPKTTLSSR